jgi:hypothetical protein
MEHLPDDEKKERNIFMKNIILILISLFLLIILNCRCTKENGEEYFRKNQNPYFPIAKGNYWKYHAFDQFADNDSFLVVVDSFEKYDGVWYAKIEETMYKNGQKRNQWVNYWTYGSYGEILAVSHPPIKHSSSKAVYYNTQSDTGREWIINTIQDGGTVELVEIISNRQFEDIECNDCLHYYISGVEWERNEFLCKGIGLVMKGYYILYDYSLN